MIIQSQFILYVSDQEKSTGFYQRVLQLAPCLNVPGMTEFKLSENNKLGLMPEKGIAKILQNKTPHPTTGKGIPRCELYLLLNDVTLYIKRAFENGAKIISPLQEMDWGDRGHIIAFAEKIN